ncbi:MAG: type II toxin-antitoxin system HipA family toxin [Acidobacteria bacterium]|nr:type II toxin-antitoxin system HipA family toxin [Acidobacteriota bacterium]
MSLAEVRLWGETIGAVRWDADQELGFFEYTPEFRADGLQVAPLTLPLDPRIYSFPELERRTFHGLPGLLADSLPDRFGNALIDAWLQRRGRPPGDLDPVERLCYIGRRGMGALQFEPATGPEPASDDAVEVDRLASLASEILTNRSELGGQLDAEGMAQILRVGTSAGGARAKAVISWNPATNEVRSGQLDLPPGFEHWILKFDGVSGNRDKEADDPVGFGRIEFAYSEMARAAGIEMAECRVHATGEHAHFMTRRFDRTVDGGRIHMLSLGAVAHFDYNMPGGYSYEQAFSVVERLGLPAASREQLFRRMVFNLVARNQDDHVKNTAFLMDEAGSWTLSPAFDVTYSYNPEGRFTSQHQMTVNGRRTEFVLDDLVEASKHALLPRGRAKRILGQCVDVVSQWSEFAAGAEVPEDAASRIAAAHRLRWHG